MRNNQLDRYLEQLHTALAGLSASEKAEIVMEIQSHVQDSLEEKNCALDDVLSDLGNPTAVAQRYLDEKGIKKPKSNTSNTVVTVSKWLSLSVVGSIGAVVILLITLLWGFSPVVQINDSGIKLLNGAITISGDDHKDHSRNQIEIQSTKKPAFKREHQPDIAIYGSYDGNNEQEEKLSVYGKTTLKNSEVSEKLSVHGRLSGENIIIGEATIFGRAELKNAQFNKPTSVFGRVDCGQCTFESTADIHGSLVARSSQFKDELQVSASSIRLQDTQAQQIVVGKNKQPVTITLTGNSVINGDIVFQSKNGTVTVTPGVKLLGKIKGGSIITED